MGPAIPAQDVAWDVRRPSVDGNAFILQLSFLRQWCRDGQSRPVKERPEHRIFQQSVYETPVGLFPFALTNRTRLEERWIEQTDQTAFRLRHMLRGMQPIGNTGKWALVAYDEVFLNLNDVDNGPQEGFAQNRAFFGFNRELTPSIHGEFGYLNQFIRSDGKEDSMNHNGLLALYYQW